MNYGVTIFSAMRSTKMPEPTNKFRMKTNLIYVVNSVRAEIDYHLKVPTKNA